MSRKRTHARPAPPGRLLPLVVGFVVVTIVAIGAALLLSGHVPHEVPVDPAAPGRLTTDQATVDLGRVPFDKLAEARFELANTGGDVVRLVGAPRVRMLEGC
jgi:hypothetical protein